VKWQFYQILPQKKHTGANGGSLFSLANLLLNCKKKDATCCILALFFAYKKISKINKGGVKNEENTKRDYAPNNRGKPAY